MRRSIATVSLSGALVDKLDAIAAAGFDGVEIFDQDLTCSAVPAAEIGARCADLGLRVELFQPLRDIVGMHPEVFPDRLRFAEAKFDVMRRLGADRVLVCSAVHPRAVDDPDLLVEQLARLGERAAEHGGIVAYEALAWGSVVDRLGAAWRAVARCGRANVGLAVDTFHLLARGDDASALRDIPGDRIAFLQIADAPVLAMDVLEWSRHHRCFPGQGSLDVLGVVAAVVEAGYRGPLSLEVFSDIVREAPASDTARDAMRSLLYLEEALGAHWSGPDSTSSPRPAVELFHAARVPPAPEAAFVEIEQTGQSLAGARLLAALGLTPDPPGPPGTDGWWRCGGALVRLTQRVRPGIEPSAPATEPTRAGTEDRHGLAVVGLGVAVDDPSDAVSRAAALGWPVGHPGGAGPSVTSPTGVQVFFGDRADPGAADGAPGWPSAEPARPVPGDASAWLGIDHVGAAVDAERSDAEVSFYRTLLGLRPGPVSEFFDPVGRLRSRLLLPPEGGLRVVLNIVVRAGGAAPVGLNQVAFRCTGLLDLVARLRATAAPLLQVPEAYYEDLQARVDLPAELLGRLRALGVLYDRDEHGGELLHVYTPVIGGSFFIELLERRGGYAGYGAANTPVRLALQAAAPGWP